MLRNGSFLRLWIGSTVSRFGTALSALNFVAVVTLGATPLQMGILTAAGVAPGLFFGLFAGVLTDRINRKPLLVWAGLGRAAALASVPAAFFMDALRVEHLYTVAFVNGLFRTFFDVSLGAVVPGLVGRERLVEANSRLSASGSAIDIGGFSVGGWIVQLTGTMAAVGVGTVSFLSSALLLLSVRTREPPKLPEENRSGGMGELWSGLVYVAGHRSLRALCGSAVAEGMVHGLVGSLILLFGLRELQMDTGVLATILATGGVCSLLGALSSRLVARRFGIGPATVIGFALFAAGTLLIPAAQGPLFAAGAILVCAQLSETAYAVYEVNELSLRQALTPDSFLGRVNATVRVVGIGAFMIASVVGGLLAETIGLRWTMASGGACGLVGALWLLRSPVWNVQRLPDE